MITSRSLRGRLLRSEFKYLPQSADVSGNWSASQRPARTPGNERHNCHTIVSLSFMLIFLLCLNIVTAVISEPNEFDCTHSVNTALSSSSFIITLCSCRMHNMQSGLFQRWEWLNDILTIQAWCTLKLYYFACEQRSSESQSMKKSKWKILRWRFVGWDTKVEQWVRFGSNAGFHRSHIHPFKVTLSGNWMSTKF